MADWMHEHAWWISAASVLAFFASVAMGIVFTLRMPGDFFTRSESGSVHHRKSLIARISRNLLGAGLLCVGIIAALPLVPGPGLLLIVAGISFTDIPGKRRLQRRIICRPWVLRPVNAVRKRFGKVPLEVPGKS